MFRWLASLGSLSFPVVIGAVVFSAAGRCDLPFVWALLGVLTLFSLTIVLFGDAGMLRERCSPGRGGKDRVTRPLGAVLLLAHWVLAGWDLGRWRTSETPWEMQLLGLAIYAVAMVFLGWTMHANPFYSSVVRVQNERGHYPVAVGPYRFVRHPGYAATMLAMLAGGIALGSWVAMLPIVVLIGLFLRRTVLEDRLLHRDLAGYAKYAEGVRYRLIPGVI